MSYEQNYDVKVTFENKTNFPPKNKEAEAHQGIKYRKIQKNTEAHQGRRWEI